MDAPEPANPVSEGSFEVLDDGYEWSFANGARVMFAPSDIAEGIVNLHAQSLGGWSRLEPGDRALSAIAVNAVQGSGLGDLSRSELDRFLEDSTRRSLPTSARRLRVLSGPRAATTSRPCSSSSTCW